jgi:hypothetical protein
MVEGKTKNNQVLSLPYAYIIISRNEPLTTQSSR